MKTLHLEVQQFISASKHLLASTMNPDQLSKMGQDMIRYYLTALGEKYSGSLTESA